MTTEFVRVKSRQLDIIKRIDQIDFIRKELAYDHETKEKNKILSISIRYLKEIDGIGISVHFESIEERDAEFERISVFLNTFAITGKI